MPRLAYVETESGFPRKAYSIRLEQELIDDFKEMARKQRTSAAIYIETAIMEKLEKDKKKKKYQ